MAVKEDIYSQDRFYVNLEQDCVIWMYHNPDANSGDQFVSNIFDMDLLNEALTEKASPEYEIEDVYDFIGSECRQYCTDVGDYAYDIAKEKFESEPDSIGMTYQTVENIKLIFEAKDKIDEYCMGEFAQHADFNDPKRIGLAYTTTEDDKHDIQVYANLPEHRIEVYLDNKQMATQEYDSLRSFVNNGLSNLDFNELTSIPDWVMDRFLEKGFYRKDMKFMQLEAWNTMYDTCIEVGSYLFGEGLYLELHDIAEGMPEPYADITVNLEGYPTKGSCAFVDTNNFANAEQLIKQYKLGTPTGRLGRSGYCTYPEYKFDLNEIRKYCINPEEIDQKLEKMKGDRDAR